MKMLNTAKAIPLKLSTIGLMTGCNSFNCVRKKGNRLHYSREKFKCILETAKSSV